MPSILATLSICALVVLAYMTLAYAVARRTRRSDVADVTWGGGFIAVALAAFLANLPETVSFTNPKVIVLLFSHRLGPAP